MSKCTHELCKYWNKERGSCFFFVEGSGEVEDMPCYDVVSKQAVNTLVDELARAISDERCHVPQRGRSAATIMQDILDLPPVTQKPKYWIDEDNKLYKMPDDIPIKESEGLNGNYFTLYYG